jgi:hypothetical protein
MDSQTNEVDEVQRQLSNARATERFKKQMEEWRISKHSGYKGFPKN